MPTVTGRRPGICSLRSGQNANWSGWGFTHLKLYYTQAIQGVTGILGGAALTVSLFTQKVPASAGRLTILNHPLFLAGILLLITAVTCFGPVLVGRANYVWNTLSEKVRFGNRVFGCFAFMQPGKKEEDMDRRMYCQSELAEHYVRTVNIFGVGSPVAKASQTTVGLSKALSGALSALLSGVVYVFVCLKALGGAFGIGSVTQYVSAVTTFSGNAALLLSTVSHMQANAEFLKTIYTFLDIPNSMYQGSLTTEKRSDRQYDVEFRDVSFHYPGSDIWALRHVNMKFKVGKRLAIVGENGSGKTTFIKLLCVCTTRRRGRFCSTASTFASTVMMITLAFFPWCFRISGSFASPWVRMFQDVWNMTGTGRKRP